MRTVVATVLFACACGSTAPAKPAPAATAAKPAPPVAESDQVVIGERLSLHSDVLGEDRQLMVYRPPDAGDKTPLPVIYLLDGEAHFHHASGLVAFINNLGRMPPAIVVGIVNTDRTRDLTPGRNPDAPTSGGADKFLDFIERELMPAVDARYPTAPYRILIGHSLGGLLSLHALATRPELFDAVIAISPSLQWPNQTVADQIDARLTGKPALDKTLYVAVGGEEGEMMVGNARAFADRLRKRAPASLRWRFEEMATEDHGSVVHDAIHHGLRLVFDGWNVPVAVETLAALEAHYANLGKRFKITVDVPENVRNLLGYRLLAAKKVDDAIAAFRRNVELHPDSANVYDSLGEALEAKGDRAAALDSYERAVKTAAANRDPTLELFRKRLDEAKIRLGGTK